MKAPHLANHLIDDAVEYGLSLKIDAPWETNGQGQIIVNPPPGYRHAARASQLDRLLAVLAPDWPATADVAIHTLDGIKGPDLTLARPGFQPTLDARGHLLAAPAICIEIMSPTNTWAEMRHKTMLYLAAGAEEVWVCDEAGVLNFFDGTGQLHHSALITDLPARLE